METVYTYDTDIVSDLHKDAYGFRPRGAFWQNWEASTEDEKQAEWNSLLEACQRAIERQREEEALAIVRFEKLLEKTVSRGAGDRETALRWIMDASGIDNGDWEFLCYEHGLPYGYFKAKK